MNLEFQFSCQEVIAMFRSVGLSVERRALPFRFPKPNGLVEEETIPTWVVIKPNGIDYVPMDVLFRAYLNVQKRRLFLSPNPIDVYVLLENLS